MKKQCIHGCIYSWIMSHFLLQVEKSHLQGNDIILIIFKSVPFQNV